MTAVEHAAQCIDFAEQDIQRVLKLWWTLCVLSNLFERLAFHLDLFCRVWACDDIVIFVNAHVWELDDLTGEWFDIDCLCDWVWSETDWVLE